MAKLWPPILRMNRVGATILRNAHGRLNKYSCPRARPDSEGLRCFRHSTNLLVGNKRPCCKSCQHRNPTSEILYHGGMTRIKQPTKANIVGTYIYTHRQPELHTRAIRAFAKLPPEQRTRSTASHSRRLRSSSRHIHPYHRTWFLAQVFMEFLSIQAYNCQEKKNARQQRYKAPHTPPPIEKAEIQTLRTH